jgi:hemerythrin
MSFMPWTDAFALGIETIDQQHHWLVDATNRLHAEISKAAPDRSVLGEIIDGLVGYTMNHFVYEEELFQRLNYAETAAHQTEHDVFTATAMDLLLRFESGEEADASVLDFLKDWLQHHILKVDRSYVPFLLAAGVR